MMTPTERNRILKYRHQISKHYKPGKRIPSEEAEIYQVYKFCQLCGRQVKKIELLKADVFLPNQLISTPLLLCKECFGKQKEKNKGCA